MIVKGQHPIHFLLRDHYFLSVKIDGFGLVSEVQYFSTAEDGDVKTRMLTNPGHYFDFSTAALLSGPRAMDATRNDFIILCVTNSMIGMAGFFDIEHLSV